MRMMDLSERVSWLESQLSNLTFHADGLSMKFNYPDVPELLRDLIADWNRLRTENTAMKAHGGASLLPGNLRSGQP